MILGLADVLPQEPMERAQGDEDNESLMLSKKRFDMRDLKDLVFKG